MGKLKDAIKLLGLELNGTEPTGENLSDLLKILAKEYRLEVGNMETLTTTQCDSLACGEIVVKKDSAGKHAYIVSYKKEDEMSLTYADHSNVEEVYYEKHDGVWTHIITETTHIGQ